MNAMNGATPPETLCAIARQAIAAQLRGQVFTPPSLEAPWHQARGVFVTLRVGTGQLRGCIGHIEPVHGSLSDEIASCAVSSAFQDTRFRTLQPDELDGLHIEVSVLCAPEPIADGASLDPRRYGVIVSSGPRRGVLLPDIDGIDTIEDQIRIAAQKAGIPPGTPVELQRFEVQKVAEA